MKHKCLAEHTCPLARAYNVIGDWWSLLVVTQVVLGGRRRFCDIQQVLGVAKNILTSRLRKLVEFGILEKAPASDGSAFQEYVATEKGRELYIAIVALRQWGEKYYAEGECSGVELVDRFTKKPVPPVKIVSAAGKTLAANDLVLQSTEPEPVASN